MESIDFNTLSLAIVAILNALATILTPIITAIITNINNIKLAKIENFDKERIKALNSFIKDSHLYFSLIGNGNPTQETINQYHNSMIESFLNLQLYFNLDAQTREKLFKIEHMGGYEEDWQFRNDLIVSLSNQVNKYIK